MNTAAPSTSDEALVWNPHVLGGILYLLNLVLVGTVVVCFTQGYYNCSKIILYIMILLVFCVALLIILYILDKVDFYNYRNEEQIIFPARESQFRRNRETEKQR